MVLVSKENKNKVYNYLLSEGVIVIKKDFGLPKHSAGLDVPNIQCIMILKSLKSRDLVNLVFNWQYFYYTINEKGIKYIKDSLGVSENVQPLTWIKTSTRKVYTEDGDEEDRPGRPRGRGGRGGFRGRGGRGGRVCRGFGRGSRRDDEEGGHQEGGEQPTGPEGGEEVTDQNYK